MKRALLAACILGLGVPPTLGEMAKTKVVDGATYVLGIAVSGHVQKNGNLMLSVVPGPIVTNALRLYSEPSHTLLLAIVDHEYQRTTEGRRWWEETLAPQLKRRADPLTPSELLSETPVALVTGPLPEANPTVQIKARPPTDDSIAIWVNGSFRPEIDQDLLLGVGKVGSRDFDFSGWLAVDTKLASSAAGRLHVSLEGGDLWCCGQMGQPCSACASCSNFTCCLESTPECSSCRKYLIYCKSYECWPCN